jgi:hemerythrin
MQSHHYPGLKRHQHVHNNLLKKVAKLIEEFEQQEECVSIKSLPEFLHEWLAHHIHGEDQNLIRFLRSLDTSEA